jgi:tetratricopeptide (TPR) repeat protein
VISIRAALSLLGGTPAEIDAGIQDIQAVISKMPRNAVLRYNLARALLAKGDVKGARVQIDEAIKLQPSYTAPRFLLTQLHLSRREYGEALSSTQEILRVEPGNVAARLYQAQAISGTGDLPRARQELENILKQAPNLLDAKLQLAALDLRSKQSAQAEASFKKIFADTKDIRALTGLVQSTVAQGRIDQAKGLIRHELDQRPNHLQLRMMLADLELSTGQYQNAVSEYKAILEKAPKAPEPWMRIGEAYRRLGDSANAVTAYKKAQEAAPSNAGPYLQLALLYENSGQREDAMPLYEKALDLQPDNPIALNNLAYMLADTGSNLDRALTLAQRARQQVPNDPNIADTLGFIYVKKNLHDSAIALFQELIEREPKRATFRLHLAEALAKKGDKTQARKELETALQQNPPKQEEERIRQLMASI